MSHLQQIKPVLVSVPWMEDKALNSWLCILYCQRNSTFICWNVSTLLFVHVGQYTSAVVFCISLFTHKLKYERFFLPVLPDWIGTSKNSCLPGKKLIFFGKGKVCSICLSSLHVLLYAKMYFVNNSLRSALSTKLTWFRNDNMSVTKLALLSIAGFVESVHVTKCFYWSEFSGTHGCFQSISTCNQ